MSIFNNPIIDAYKNMQEATVSDSFLVENSMNLLGSVELDVLVDQLIGESIYRESLKTEEVITLNEELLDSEKYHADRMASTSGREYYLNSFIEQHPEAKKAFMAHRANEGKGRIRIPVTLSTEHSNPDYSVMDHLKAHGYSVDESSYKDGLASKSIQVGNPEKGIPIQDKIVKKRVGQILSDTNAPSHIKKAFEEDPYRTGTKTKNYDLIISHHPHDVYGMSTGRGWTSCAQMRKGEKGYDGPASRKMSEEINNFTHVAYIVPSGGSVDTEAKGRMAFKLHKSIDGSHSTLIGEQVAYGPPPKGFREKAVEEMGKLFPIRHGAIYKKNSEVYNDNHRTFHFGETEATPEQIDTAWKSVSSRDKDARGELISMVRPNVKYKTTTLRNISKSLHDAESLASSDNFPEATRALMRIDDEHHKYLAYTGHRLGDKSEYHRIVNHVASSFNIDNDEHMNSLKQYGSASFKKNNFQNDVYQSTKKHILGKRITTPEDAAKNIIAKEHLNIRPYEAGEMNLSDNHKLGSNPILTVSKQLDSMGQLNKNTFNSVFFALHKKTKLRGNFYDHAANLIRNEVPSASHVVHQIASDMGQSRAWSGQIFNSEKEMAKKFHYMRPENRSIFSSVAGVDHVALLKKYKKELKADDDRINTLIQKTT
jgi:hypothetical protein